MGYIIQVHDPECHVVKRTESRIGVRAEDGIVRLPACTVLYVMKDHVFTALPLGSCGFSR